MHEEDYILKASKGLHMKRTTYEEDYILKGLHMKRTTY